MQSGRSPVAIGSSVPRWPMLARAWRRFTARTTPAELIPEGLSTRRMPSLIDVLSAIAVLALRRPLGIAQEARDPPGLVELIVPVEAELRREAKLEPHGQ